MADEPTGVQPDAGELAPKNEPNVAVQAKDVAPALAGPAPDAPDDAEAGDDAAPAAAAAADEPELTPEQKKLKQAEWNAKQNRYEASQAKKRLAELEAENAALKAAATKPAAPNANDAAAANANAPEGGFRSQQEFDAAVQREADTRAIRERAQADQRAFDDACNATFNKGVETYKDDFQQAVSNLQSVGIMNRDVLDLVLATEDPAKVLFDLGSDPDRAQAILDMTPAKRAVEIAKLSVVAPKKAADPLSRAPAPIRPVEGTARVSGDPRDDDDDAAWFAKRQAQRAARYA